LHWAALDSAWAGVAAKPIELVIMARPTIDLRMFDIKKLR
jgi:hypothetical protein